MKPSNLVLMCFIIFVICLGVLHGLELHDVDLSFNMLKDDNKVERVYDQIDTKGTQVKLVDLYIGAMRSLTHIYLLNSICCIIIGIYIGIRWKNG